MRLKSEPLRSGSAEILENLIGAGIRGFGGNGSIERLSS